MDDEKHIPRIGPPSVAQHGRVEYQPDEDDHEEHVDERWLISYADMMTLLFGLFVLLFSMSTLDPKTAAAIKAQAEATFNKKEEAAVEPPQPAPPDRTPELEERILSLERELSATSAQVGEKDARVADLENKLAKRSREPELEARLAERERELEHLKESREELKRRLASVTVGERDAQSAERENERLRQDLEKMKSDLQAANESAELAKETLKKEIESKAGGRGQNFMAFFINWATKDHDVDLVIEDPKGKIFDFKRREYKGHPGFFALDTRRGPGVELWQSKDILPGRYKATYSLYNDYGNSESAPVNAVILTPKGSFELPLNKLDTKVHRRVTAEFEVDAGGGVRVLKAGN